MNSLFAVCVLILGIMTFALLCVIAFSPDDFWNRNSISVKNLKGSESGCLFCLWYFRCWSVLAIVTCSLYAVVYLAGGKNA